MDRPPLHPEDPGSSAAENISYPHDSTWEDEVVPVYEGSQPDDPYWIPPPAEPREPHAPFAERYGLVPGSPVEAPVGDPRYYGIPQHLPAVLMPQDVLADAGASQLKMGTISDDFPFPHKFTAELVDPADDSVSKTLFLNARFLSNLFCDLLDVFGTMCLGAIVGGSLVLGVGILYDHLKANRNAISQMIEVKEKQASAIQKVKQEIERLKNELFKDHQSVIVNGALGRQATGYLSALILEKNRIRREAAYKTRLCQTFEDTLKILQDNLEGLGTRTALLNAREEIRKELQAVCLKEQRAVEMEASLKDQISERAKKIEKAGFEEMSVSQIKRLVNDAHNRLKSIQRTMADLAPPTPDMACDEDVPGQNSVLMWTDFD